MGLRTVAIAYDTAGGFPQQIRRLLPESWPSAQAVVGNTLFVPPVDGVFSGDWLVALTPLPPILNTDIPVSRRIFFVQEPPEYWTPSKEILAQFAYIVSPYPLEGHPATVIPGVTSGLFWWYGMSMSGHRLVGKPMSIGEIAAEPVATKTRLISTITSTKSFLAGHRSRLEFTLKLKAALGEKLDVYGEGINPIADKRDALLPYRFHVAIENAVYPNYWTEKLADPIIGRCVVFYHGATEVSRYFSSSVVIPIDIQQPRAAIETIEEMISRAHIDDEDIEASRQSLLENFNFPGYCNRLIDAIENLGKA